MSQFIKNFITEEEGVTAIEYALIAALIAIVIIAALVVVGARVDQVFDIIGTALGNAITASGGTPQNTPTR